MEQVSALHLDANSIDLSSTPIFSVSDGVIRANTMTIGSSTEFQGGTLLEFHCPDITLSQEITFTGNTLFNNTSLQKPGPPSNSFFFNNGNHEVAMSAFFGLTILRDGATISGNGFFDGMVVEGAINTPVIAPRAENAAVRFSSPFRVLNLTLAEELDLNLDINDPDTYSFIQMDFSSPQLANSNRVNVAVSGSNAAPGDIFYSVASVGFPTEFEFYDKITGDLLETDTQFEGSPVANLVTSFDLQPSLDMREFLTFRVNHPPTGEDDSMTIASTGDSKKFELVARMV